MISAKGDINNYKNAANDIDKLFKKSDTLLNLNHLKHKLARPPKQAYLYFPTENEICEIKKIDSHKFTVNRRIFQGNVKYSEFELEKFDEFIRFSIEKAETTPGDSNKIKDILTSIKNLSKNNENNNSKIEDNLNQLGFSRSDLLRFLISFEFDNKKTLQSLIDYYNFKANTYPIEFNEKIKKILLSGFIYIHGRDNRFRPIIILNPNIFLIESKNDKNLTYNDWMLSVIYLLDYCISFMLIPGQIESWNIICDMKDIALYSVPNDLKNLLTIIQQNYKNRLNTMFVVNLGMLAGLIWNVIIGLMGENIQKKMKMINSKNNFGELYEKINRNQLEVKYGGLAENIKMTYDDFSKNANSNNAQDINYNTNSSTNHNSFKVNQNKSNDLTNNGNYSRQNEDDFFSINKFYFPPNMPSDEYFTEADLEKLADFLIGENEYKIKVMKDKSIIRSPFYKYESSKDLRKFSVDNNNVISIESSSEEDKMVLEPKHSQLFLNNEEEFYSARDYLNADSSSIINTSIYPEIIKMRKHRENLNNPFYYCNSYNIDDMSNNLEVISFKKKPKEDFNDKTIKEGKLIDFSGNIDLKNTSNIEKNTRNNKVTLLKKNKEGNNKKNSTNNRNNKNQEIIIDEKEEAKKCKVSCGQVKMECSVF